MDPATAAAPPVNGAMVAVEEVPVDTLLAPVPEAAEGMAGAEDTKYEDKRAEDTSEADAIAVDELTDGADVTTDP